MVQDKYKEKDFVLEDNLFDDTENDILHEKQLKKIKERMDERWTDCEICMRKPEEFLLYCMVPEFSIVEGRMSSRS